MTQATTPQTHGPAIVIEALRQALISEASEAHQQFPQYQGHWNNYRVAEVTRLVRTKLGIAFQPGDLVLVAPDTYTDQVPPRRPAPVADWPTKEFATAYSRRNGIDTSIPVAYVREVQVDK